MADVCTFVQILDAPVPQTGNQLLEIFRHLDTVLPELVIDVPKISQDRIQQRLVDRDLRLSQTAEQLTEMPAVLSPSLLQQQLDEQIVDIPVPRGRRFSTRTSFNCFILISRSADEGLKGFFTLFPGAHQMAWTESPDEESEEEDPNRWVDEHGRIWRKTATLPRRWWLLGTDIFWDEPGQVAAGDGEGGGGWRLLVVVVVFSQDKVLQRLLD